MRLTRTAALAGLVAGLAALALGGQTPSGALERALGYRIGPEDVLLISVWNNETLTRTVPVRPDGMISLPLLNDVQAAGFTPLELKEFLTKRLAEFMTQPEVSVIVTEVRSFKVSVIGNVGKPGRYEFKSWTTVMDVLAAAGGLTEFASPSRIAVLRAEKGSPKIRRIPFDYESFDREEDEAANFYVLPGDIVLVP